MCVRFGQDCSLEVGAPKLEFFLQSLQSGMQHYSVNAMVICLLVSTALSLTDMISISTPLPLTCSCLQHLRAFNVHNFDALMVTT